MRLTVLMGTRPGRLTLVVFRRRERLPNLVVKLTTNENATHLTREARVLDLAQSELGRLVNQPLPRQLGFIQEPQLAALAITALRGHRAKLPDLTMSEARRNDRRRLQSHVDMVRDWSRSLREAGISDQLPRDGQFVAGRIERFIVLGKVGPKASDRLERLAEAMRASGVRWSPCWQHGDVAPGNVLWHRRRIRLVDWEAASPSHEPWRDDAYLILSLARVAQRAMGAASVSAAFQGPLASRSWAGRILASSYREEWPHPIPIGWAVIATVIEHALEREESDTTTATWRDLAVDLLCDDQFRATCNWLTPNW